MIKKLLQSITRFPSVIQTSYDIVKVHGGELELISSPGGSSFIIKLPVQS